MISTSSISDEEIRSLSSNLHRLSVLGRVSASFRRACDCSFAYWHRAIASVYLQSVRQNVDEEGERMQVS